MEKPSHLILFIILITVLNIIFPLPSLAQQGKSTSLLPALQSISRVAVWKHLSHALNEIKKHFNPKTL